MFESINIDEIDNINIDDNYNVLIDIRDKYEYLLSHIPRSINIPYNYLLTIPENYLNFNTNYYLYCDSGIKSRKLCERLTELGYNVIDLIGGYNKYIDDK